MNKSDYTVRRLSRNNLHIAVLLLFLLASNKVISLSPLVRSYEINFITSLINKNTVNIIFISFVLLVIQYIEKRRFYEEADEHNKYIDKEVSDVE